MRRITCFKCGKNSYSADAEGQWSCPYCGEDVTEEQPDPPGGYGFDPETRCGSQDNIDGQGNYKEMI